MTDRSDLPPEQDAVRRLLADARHDGPPPPEVVARLEETLASLVAERGEAPVPDAPVVDLAARRRRRAGVGLLAAAAVVVAGVAIGTGLPRMQGSDDAGSTAGGDSSVTDFAEDGEQDGAGSADSGGAEMAPEARQDPTDLTALDSAASDLPAELLALRSRAPKRSGLSSPQAFTACEVGDVGSGRQVEALVDGAPGLVVFRRPSGDVQRVVLYSCGSSAPVRTLTLPAP